MLIAHCSKTCLQIRYENSVKRQFLCKKWCKYPDSMLWVVGTTVVSPEKAELLGCVIGDKGIFKRTTRYGCYKGYDLRKYHRYVISICLGNDVDWGYHISRLAFQSYGIRGSTYHDGREWKFISNSTRMFNDLSQYYDPKWNARNWRICDRLFHTSRHVREGLLRGYFDADGYPYFSESRQEVLVQVNSVNLEGLMDMKCLFEGIGYNPGLYKRYSNRDVWQLSLLRKADVLHFFSQIRFSINRKQNRLESLLRRNAILK